jgi:Fe-S cluster biosynthesis and repair protein YggX
MADTAIELRNVQTDLLVLNENNARNHSKEQVKLLAKSIKEFGFVNPLIIDEGYMLLAGHGRYLAARRLRLAEVPCILLTGLTGRQKQAYVIADNKLGERSKWDRETLNQELVGLLLNGVNLEIMGFTKGEIAALTLSDEWLEKNAVDDTKRGGIWETLSYSPSLNKKRSIRFLSCFNWVDSMKRKGIAEFRHLKDACPSEFVEQVSSELFDLLSPVLAGLEGNGCWRVTAPPGKRSRKYHLATEVAKSLAGTFQIEYESAFQARTFDMTSAPKNHKKRELPVLKPELSKSNWLIVDDVATSGVTLERCTNELKSNGPVLAAVLVYENTAL